MLDSIVQFDADIFLFFNGFHNGYFDNFMSMFSGRFIWIPTYVSLLYMILRKYQPLKVLILLIGIVLSITFADQICATAIRPIFERLRPSNLQNPLSQFTHIVNDYRGGSYGFPSCHAANSFALATFAACMIKQRPFSIFVISWAILVSYSRIYLGVHYPGDLLVGGLIGAAVGYICYKVSELTFNYYAKKHDKVATAKPLLTNCTVCNRVEGLFSFLPEWAGELGAMGFVAFITTLYILLASI